MKVLFPAGIALVAMAACTPQQPPPSPPSPQGTLNQQWAGGGTGPTVVGGSAGNTTTAFDGTYKGLSNRSTSAAGTGLKAVDPSTTGCQQFDEPPTMTISNGLAQFQALGVTFAGYMTPQGHLRMSSGYGPTVDADFDAQTRTLRGRAVSINCRYDVTWQKVT
jgi:hypothetical protein